MSDEILFYVIPVCIILDQNGTPCFLSLWEFGQGPVRSRTIKLCVSSGLGEGSGLERVPECVAWTVPDNWGGLSSPMRAAGFIHQINRYKKRLCTPTQDSRPLNLPFLSVCSLSTCFLQPSLVLLEQKGT